MNKVNRTRLTAFVFTLLTCMCVASQGQSNPTSHKSSEISVFGGYLYWRPNYTVILDSGNGSLTQFGPYNASGGSLGIDFTHYFRFPVAPSLEIRANVANGGVNEKSYVTGLRLTETSFGRYHPYVVALAGKGNIHYKGLEADYLDALGDNSAVFDLGGGLGIDITRRFQFVADFQAQRWHLGGPDKFYPVGAMLGLSYRIPFRDHVSQRDLGR